MQKANKDWHTAEIKCALEKNNMNFAKLGRIHGISGATIRNALRIKYPKAEKIIADAIGVPPQKIWPSRYQTEA